MGGRAEAVSGRMGRLALAAAATAIVFLLSVRYFPPGVDYVTTYRPTARAWITGELDLYDPTGRLGFYNMPWTLLATVPLSLLPERVGLAVLTVGSVAAIAVSLGWFARPGTVRLSFLPLAGANLHTFDLIFRGQIDALVLLGLAATWRGMHERKPWLMSLGLLIMLTKPVNVLPATVLFLWSIRRWSGGELGRVVALPAAGMIGSFLALGIDWPLRYVEFVRQFPPTDHMSTSLWRVADMTGVPAWAAAALAILAVAGLVVQIRRNDLTIWTLGMALTIGLLITPYANGYHYVLLLPVLLAVARVDGRAALGAYLMTFLPLTRLWLGTEAVVIDILYPISLLAMCWYFGGRGLVEASTSG